MSVILAMTFATITQANVPPAVKLVEREFSNFYTCTSIAEAMVIRHSIDKWARSGVAIGTDTYKSVLTSSNKNYTIVLECREK